MDDPGSGERRLEWRGSGRQVEVWHASEASSTRTTYPADMTVTVLPDAAALATFSAGLVAAYVRPGVDIALAGGSTPRAMYEVLADRGVDWTGVDCWFADDRWVPIDHPDSNAGMALEATRGAVRGSLLPIPHHDAVDPHIAAAQYEDLLRARLGDAGGVIRPGLVMLGIGDDCHTASLFPGTEALAVTDRDVVANWVPAKDAWRITTTMPLLHRAEQLVFLVQGPGKADALAEVLEGDGSTPAARVAAGGRDVHWLVDEAAAAHLRSTPLHRPT
jgi:6-phosphogluconolactonase